MIEPSLKGSKDRSILRSVSTRFQLRKSEGQFVNVHIRTSNIHPIHHSLSFPLPQMFQCCLDEHTHYWNRFSFRLSKKLHNFSFNLKFEESSGPVCLTWIWLLLGQIESKKASRKLCIFFVVSMVRWVTKVYQLSLKFQVSHQFYKCQSHVTLKHYINESFSKIESPKNSEGGFYIFTWFPWRLWKLGQF